VVVVIEREWGNVDRDRDNPSVLVRERERERERLRWSPARSQWREREREGYGFYTTRKKSTTVRIKKTEVGMLKKSQLFKSGERMCEKIEEEEEALFSLKF